MEGETKEAYDELVSLEDQISDPNVLYEINKVLTEIFSRVKYNSGIIYRELRRMNYCFWGTTSLDTRWPIRFPKNNTQKLIRTLEIGVQPIGHIPLSLKYFYSIVGSINFTWDYEKKEQIKWPGSDPLEIIALEDAISIVTNKYWEEEMKEYLSDEDYQKAFLELSGDFLHKDNISGGPPYSIALTKNKSVDGFMIHMPEKIRFVDYLRRCFEYGGFYRGSEIFGDTEYDHFLSKVKKRLKKI